MTIAPPKPDIEQSPLNSQISKSALWQSLLQRTPLGWLQLKKNKTRLLVAIAGIGFADLLMLAQLGIQAALFDSNTLVNRNLDADIILRSSQYRDLNLANTLPRRRLYQVKDIPGVASVDALYIARVTWKNPQTRRKTDVTIIGQNLERSALTIPAINQNLNKLKSPDTFLFDRLTRGEYGNIIPQLESGKHVTTEIDRRTITVVGLFDLGASFATDGTIVTSQENFLRFFPERNAGQVTLGLVKVEPGYDPEQVVAQLKASLPPDVLVATKSEFTELEQAYWQKNTPIGIVFTFGTVMAFVVGTVIVFQILSTDVNDHLAEYATFKAMGYHERYLLLIVFEEAIILAVLGFIPGLGLALAQYQLIRTVAALPIQMTLSRVTLVLILTIVMCAVSGAIATRKLRSADPADIF